MTDTTMTGGNRRIAWITGAGSGIGRALALRLARDGWIVAVSSRTKADLDSLAVEGNGRIHAYPLDVVDEAAAEDTVSNIEADLGPIGLAVLNAGIYQRVSARGFSAEKFRKMVDVNLSGTANCLAPIIPRMRARKAGHIAVVSSLTGYAGLPSAAAYGATKAALINMCEALYPELAVDSVKLTVITPGFVDTPATKSNDFPMPFLIGVDDAVERIVRGLESGRFEISFPRRMTLLVKLLGLLPHPLRFAVTRRMVRDD